MNEIALRLAQHIRGEAAHGIDSLGAVLAQLAVAGKLIARELAHAALAGRLGTTGEINVQGEVVKKLDVWGNEVVVRALEASGHVCLMISEEMEQPLHLAERCGDAEFVVCFDPVYWFVQPRHQRRRRYDLFDSATDRAWAGTCCGRCPAAGDRPGGGRIHHVRPQHGVRLHRRRRRPRLHARADRSEEHTSELQSLAYLVCRLLLEKKKTVYCSR